MVELGRPIFLKKSVRIVDLMDIGLPDEIYRSFADGCIFVVGRVDKPEPALEILDTSSAKKWRIYEEMVQGEY